MYLQSPCQNIRCGSKSPSDSGHHVHHSSLGKKHGGADFIYGIIVGSVRVCVGIIYSSSAVGPETVSEGYVAEEGAGRVIADTYAEIVLVDVQSLVFVFGGIPFVFASSHIVVASAYGHYAPGLPFDTSPDYV